MQKAALFQKMLAEKLGVESTADTASLSTTQNMDLFSAQSNAATSAYNADTVLQTKSSENLTQQAQPYMQYIKSASAKYNIPVNLILGVIKAESDFNTQSVSYAGAKGLMQLMPENCMEDGVSNPFDPAQNIEAGTAEISRVLGKYNGDVKLALAAYNTGPGNLEKRDVTSSQSAEYQTVPQIVRDYVDRVLRYAGYET